MIAPSSSTRYTTPLFCQIPAGARSLTATRSVLGKIFVSVAVSIQDRSSTRLRAVSRSNVSNDGNRPMPSLSRISTSEASLCPVILISWMLSPNHVVTAAATVRACPPRTTPARPVVRKRASAPLTPALLGNRQLMRLNRRAHLRKLGGSNSRGDACGVWPSSPDIVRPASAQRLHEASSTIQCTSAGKSMPAWAAISGTSDVAVMPGCVLTSRQTRPSIPSRRSSNRKSARLTPRQPKV